MWRSFLIKNAQFVEELFLSDFQPFSDVFQGELFPNLRVLRCGDAEGVLDIQAPKLVSLEIGLNKDNVNIQLHLESLPYLSRLIINSDYKFEWSEMYLTIHCAENENFSEIHIYGRYASMAFIEPLLERSPNLKLLDLTNANMTKDEYIRLSRRFPKVRINVLLCSNELARWRAEVLLPQKPLMKRGAEQQFSRSIQGEKKELNIKPVDEREEGVIYTSPVRSKLTSDFDTQYDSLKKTTMHRACKHLSKNKSRFLYTREKLYTLSAEKLFSPLNSTISSNYTLPSYQSTLLTDPNHDFYEFQEKIDLQVGDCFNISSLSAQDILLQIMLNGQTLSDADIELEQNEFGFYTLKAKTTLKGNFSYLLDVPAEGRGWKDHIPNELYEMIKTIQSFSTVNVGKLDIPSDATVQQKLEAMYEQRKGACRHRVAILLHLFEKLSANHPEVYKPIKVRAVDRGGVHVNIELSVDGGNTFEQLDLGGYQVSMQYLSTKLPALQFSSKQRKEAPKPTFTEVLDLLVQSYGKNMLLCLPNPSNIDVCLSYLKQTFKSRPVFYVDSEEQLQTSLKRLKLNDACTECELVNPPTGLLHEFLMAHQDSEPAPAIIINWDRIKLSTMVQFNSVIDIPNRRVDNTPIPVKAMIVGLHSRNEKLMDLLGDSSFVSRHASGGIYEVNTQWLPRLTVSENTAFSEAARPTLKIKLYQSPRWQELLIGGAYVHGRKLRWRNGALIKLIQKPSLSQIDLVDPPVNDSVFNKLIADLRAGQPLQLLNQILSIGRPIEVNLISESLSEKNVLMSVKGSSKLIGNAFVINSLTFESCLHNKRITDDGLLVPQKGLVEASAHMNLRLCICDSLSASQWSLLLNYAQHFNVTLDVTVTNNVSLLKGIKCCQQVDEPTVLEEPQNLFIVSNDVEYSVLKILKELPLQSIQPMVIDLSELSLDDVLFKVEHRITDSGFVFKKKISPIWEALSRGETVILKGYCSADLLNYLASAFSPSPYFYMEGKCHVIQGQLIVVADNSLKIPDWLNVISHSISAAEKQEILGLAIDESCENKPLIQMAMEYRKQQSLGQNEFTISRSSLDDRGEFSLTACELFESRRLEAVKQVLSYSPFLLLEGAPGVGKSYFLRMMQNDPSFKLYREDQIELWATEPVTPGVQKILFRDEINLRGAVCAKDRDLLNNPPSLFNQGTYYRLPESCKIMYAQNPLSYGGERVEPQLFRDLPDCKVVFQAMPPSFVLHRILKPIYETIFKLEEAEQRATQLIKECFASMRTIRDLQTKAIFECALDRHSIPQPPEGTKQVCLGLNDFVLTVSRFAPYREVLTLLRARLFKRELPETAPDGARYNGVNGLILQGPPGVGKSEFIEAVLNSEEYSEITASTSRSQMDNDRVYYRLRASVSNEEKLQLLHKAFQTGAILVIDEMDSCPLLEEYLNAYLTGEDINGNRAEQPGFTILATGNGAAMKGRRIIPPTLKSRLLALDFNEYSRDDLLSVLEAKFIPPMATNRSLRLDMISFLVDSFLTEQNKNKEVPPTFRDLYVLAKDYFENKFDQYCDLGLSKEGHEFMLVYRNHIHLPRLINAFEAGNLVASKMTLDELSKALTSRNYGFSLFESQSASDEEEVVEKEDKNNKP